MESFNIHARWTLRVCNSQTILFSLCKNILILHKFFTLVTQHGPINSIYQNLTVAANLDL